MAGQAAELAAALEQLRAGSVAAACAVAEYAQDGAGAVEALVAGGGVPVLTSVLMGASLAGGGDDASGLMGALLAAGLQPLSPLKVAALRALVTVARYPQHRGQVAGSGVVGVLAMLLMAKQGGRPVQRGGVRALVLTALAETTTDHPQLEGQDAKRDAEFAKLRGQLLTSGAVAEMAAAARASETAESDGEDGAESDEEEGACELVRAAAMTSAARLARDPRVVEALSGSGYVAAVVHALGGAYDADSPSSQVFKAALAAVEALTQLRHPSEQMSELLRPVLESLPSLTQHLSCVSCHVAVQVANALASLLQSPLPSADYKCAADALLFGAGPASSASRPLSSVDGQPLGHHLLRISALGGREGVHAAATLARALCRCPHQGQEPGESRARAMALVQAGLLSGLVRCLRAHPAATEAVGAAVQAVAASTCTPRVRAWFSSLELACEAVPLLVRALAALMLCAEPAVTEAATSAMVQAVNLWVEASDPAGHGTPATQLLSSPSCGRVVGALRAVARSRACPRDVRRAAESAMTQLGLADARSLSHDPQSGGVCWNAAPCTPTGHRGVLEMCKEHKTAGNQCFAERLYPNALDCYLEGIQRMESEYGSLLQLAEPSTKHLDHKPSVQFLPPMEHRLAPGTLVRVVQLPACAWRECTVTSVQSCDDGVEATAQVLPTHGTAELEPETVPLWRVQIVEEADTTQQVASSELRELWMQFHLNCARCYMRIGELEDADKACQACIAAESTRAAAWYIRSQVAKLRGDVRLNIECTAKAAVLDPGDAALRRQFVRIVASGRVSWLPADTSLPRLEVH